MAWQGVAWCDMALNSTVLYGVVLYGVAWRCTVLHGIEWLCVALHNIALHVIQGIPKKTLFKDFCRRCLWLKSSSSSPSLLKIQSFNPKVHCTWWWRPHIAACKLCWSLLRPGEVVLDHFFAKCIFYIYHEAVKIFSSSFYGFYPPRRGVKTWRGS